jgi:hypothetical protein
MCEPPLGHGGGGIRLGLGIPAGNANPAAPTQFAAPDLWAASGDATYSSSLSGGLCRTSVAEVKAEIGCRGGQVCS